MNETPTHHMTCAKSVKCIVLRSDEMEHISEIKAELQNVSFEKEILHQHCNELTDDLSNAKAGKSQAEEKLKDEMAKNTELLKTQQRLLQHVDEVEQLKDMENKGKKISEVGERQQCRKLKELRSKIERPVWFAKTFGIRLSAVEVKDDPNVYHTIPFANENEKQRRAYKDLTEDEKDLVKQTVFITDKFCIGETAYHELTMLSTAVDLPQSYLLRQCKNDVNSLVHITKTPGEAEGAQVDFKTELTNVIRKKFSPLSIHAYYINFFHLNISPSQI